MDLHLLHYAYHRRDGLITTTEFLRRFRQRLAELTDTQLELFANDLADNFDESSGKPYPKGNPLGEITPERVDEGSKESRDVLIQTTKTTEGHDG